MNPRILAYKYINKQYIHIYIYINKKCKVCSFTIYLANNSAATAIYHGCYRVLRGDRGGGGGSNHLPSPAM